MLQVLSIDVYVLLDLSTTLLFLTPLVSRMFYSLADILTEPFFVTIAIGDSIVARRVLRVVL